MFLIKTRLSDTVPFRGTWFRLWFSWRFMLSCHLCLLISCYGLVFCLLSFDCSFCLTAWYLYIFYFRIYYRECWWWNEWLQFFHKGCRLWHTREQLLRTIQRWMVGQCMSFLQLKWFVPSAISSTICNWNCVEYMERLLLLT